MLPNRQKSATQRNIEMIERYQAGESIDALAEAYGLARSTVYHVVVRIKRSAGSGSGTYEAVTRKPSGE